MTDHKHENVESYYACTQYEYYMYLFKYGWVLDKKTSVKILLHIKPIHLQYSSRMLFTCSHFSENCEKQLLCETASCKYMYKVKFTER